MQSAVALHENSKGETYALRAKCSTISAQHEERVVQCIGDRSLEVIEMKSAAMSVSVFLAAAISVYGADYYVSPGNAGA